jgi:hypothetical protein
MKYPEVVDQANRFPNKCLFTGDTTGPFIDFGRFATVNKPYLYLSVRAVEQELAPKLGLVARKDVEEVLAGLDAELREKTERLEALEAWKEAQERLDAARETAEQLEEATV